MSLKSGRDQNFQGKKGGMAGLTGKNGWESGIWETYCGPSSYIDHGSFCEYWMQMNHIVSPCIFVLCILEQWCILSFISFVLHLWSVLAACMAGIQRSGRGENKERKVWLEGEGWEPIALRASGFPFSPSFECLPHRLWLVPTEGTLIMLSVYWLRFWLGCF